MVNGVGLAHPKDTDYSEDMKSPDSVSWPTFCARAGYYVGLLRRGEVLDLTKQKQVVARVRRLPALTADIDAQTEGMPVLGSAEIARDTLDRIISIQDGQPVVFGRGGRREAVIEGVKA